MIFRCSSTIVEKSILWPRVKNISTTPYNSKTSQNQNTNLSFQEQFLVYYLMEKTTQWEYNERGEPERRIRLLGNEIEGLPVDASGG